jgi:hypothetical protein
MLGGRGLSPAHEASLRSVSLPTSTNPVAASTNFEAAITEPSAPLLVPLPARKLYSLLTSRYGGSRSTRELQRHNRVSPYEVERLAKAIRICSRSQTRPRALEGWRGALCQQRVAT